MQAQEIEQKLGKLGGQVRSGCNQIDDAHDQGFLIRVYVPYILQCKRKHCPSCGGDVSPQLAIAMLHVHRLGDGSQANYCSKSRTVV